MTCTNPASVAAPFAGGIFVKQLFLSSYLFLVNCTSRNGSRTYSNSPSRKTHWTTVESRLLWQAETGKVVQEVR